MLSIRPQIAKVSKPKSFTYFPRYYDERKEKLAKMEKEIRKAEEDQLKGEKKVREFHFRNSINERWRDTDYKSSTYRSNLTIVLLIVLISWVGYYLFNKFDMIELWMKNPN